MKGHAGFPGNKRTCLVAGNRVCRLEVAGVDEIAIGVRLADGVDGETAEAGARNMDLPQGRGLDRYGRCGKRDRQDVAVGKTHGCRSVSIGESYLRDAFRAQRQVVAKERATPQMMRQENSLDPA